MPLVWPSKCIFCGGSPNTWEDALPKWMQRWLRDKYPEKEWALRARYHEGDPAITAPRTARPRNENIPRAKVRVVCKTCNNEWMGDLQRESGPLLTPMMESVVTDLLPTEQHRVATWAYMTAVTMHYAAEARVPKGWGIPKERRRYLFEHKEPPPNTRIWLAGWIDDEELSPVIRTELLVPYAKQHLVNPPSRHVLQLGIGALAVFVFGSPKSWGQLNVLSQYERGLVRVWPPTIGTVRWPRSTAAFNVDAADAFVNALITAR